MGLFGNAHKLGGGGGGGRGWGLSLQPNFKKGRLDRTSTFRGGCEKEEVTFLRGGGGRC